MTEKRKDRKKITISRTFFRWLLIITAASFLVSLTFTWIFETKAARDSARSLLSTNVRDVKQDVIDASNENLLDKTWQIAMRIDAGAPTDPESLKQLMQEFDVAEINVVSDEGIIIASTSEQFLNYDMRSGKQSAEFLILLTGEETQYVQSYQPTAFDPSISRKYAAAFLYDGGFVQAGYDGRQFQKDISKRVTDAARNRHVGQDGGMILANEEQTIVSDRYGFVGKKLQKTGLRIDGIPEEEVFQAVVNGEEASCMYLISEGYSIIAVLPEKEIIQQRNSGLLVMGIAEILIFALLFLVIYLLVRRRVVDRIDRVNQSLSRITEGNLEEVVDVRSNVEFAQLSDDINSTVDTLKRYIAEAAARIDEELAYAETIQRSLLPSVFPPYPERKDFALYAAMDTAKEVGGDFYDFYLRDENSLALVVADVSGKGIPAAMFMMRAKTMLRDCSERTERVSEIFQQANDRLCEENDANMFLTAWMGVLDTKTGILRFVNAGHMQPVLIRRGKASFIEQKTNLVLAMMDDVEYEEDTIRLEPGDILYLYTDGVTEAAAADQSMFGFDRLLEILSKDFGTGEDACRQVIRTVRENVDSFVQEEPQFDDITQLCFYYGQEKE